VNIDGTRDRLTEARLDLDDESRDTLEVLKATTITILHALSDVVDALGRVQVKTFAARKDVRKAAGQFATLEGRIERLEQNDLAKGAKVAALNTTTLDEARALAGRLDRLEERLEGQTGTIHELRGEIAGLESNVRDARNRVYDLENRR